jgi:hypothetical protein
MHPSSLTESPAGYYEGNIVVLFGQSTGQTIEPASVKPADLKLMEYMLASDTHTPQAVLWLIAKFGCDSAASAVASNPNTNSKIMKLLSSNKSSIVRAALLQNVRTPRSVVCSLKQRAKSVVYSRRKEVGPAIHPARAV